MWQIVRTFPLMLLVLAIPIVPFLFFGEAFEIELQSYLRQDASESDLRLIVVALLSVDIFLPVPSSVISTVSGWRLGWLQGTLATWIGMTIGAIVGYLFALWLGPRFAGWFCRGDDLEGMKVLMRRFGPSVLVMTRAIPVFAEASVLLAGLHQLAFKRFFLSIVISNLMIALIYCSLGDLAAKYQWLAVAAGVSIGLPLLLAAISQRLVSLDSGD